MRSMSDHCDGITFVVDSVLIMASSRPNQRRCQNGQRPVLASNRYFLITMTNFPDLLNRTARRHPPHAFQLSAASGPRTMAELRVLDNAARETVLYNTLKYELEQALRSYLEQTEQMCPISLIIDLTNMQLSR